MNGRHAWHQNQWTLINELQHHNLMKTIRFSFEMNKIGSRICSYKIAFCTQCWLAIFLGFDFLFKWTCQESIIMHMLLWMNEHTVIILSITWYFLLKISQWSQLCNYTPNFKRKILIFFIIMNIYFFSLHTKINEILLINIHISISSIYLYHLYMH